MQAEASPSTSAHLNQRYSSLIWSCLDADLIRSAVFYAERYFVHDAANHDARHLYATTLLRSGQPHSAHHLVDLPSDSQCSGCLQLKAKCCTALGRHRQARQALEASAAEINYSPTRKHFLIISMCEPFLEYIPINLASMGTRQSRAFPEQASLYCQSGISALKGNQSDEATESFQQALAANPMLWEAFEGLCSLGEPPSPRT